MGKHKQLHAGRVNYNRRSGTLLLKFSALNFAQLGRQEKSFLERMPAIATLTERFPE
jgi:hypothetical protein